MAADFPFQFYEKLFKEGNVNFLLDVINSAFYDKDCQKLLLADKNSLNQSKSCYNCCQLAYNTTLKKIIERIGSCKDHTNYIYLGDNEKISKLNSVNADYERERMSRLNDK